MLTADTQRPFWNRPECAAGLSLWAVLLLAAGALSPGLSGNFIFDDPHNLIGLEAVARDAGWDATLRYAANGIASGLGRPLALLTFGVQYASWPNHPGDFIYFNICLHLLNACLLAWGLIRFFRLLPGTPAAPAVLAIVIAALWALAPLQASAVLYVVQRMASLAGTCMFIGFLLYWVGRSWSPEHAGWRGYALMAAGLGFGTGVGILAKENAALFPLLILVAELTLGHGLRRDRRWWAFAGITLVIPSVLVVAYVIWQIPKWNIDALQRDFTIWERLATECRILFLYLKKLVLPSLYSLRLLYDDIPVSRSLIDPWTTLLSVVAWLGLIAASIRWRRAAPAFAFAVLWYLASHLLESTIIPLELGFEHRNYVASVGPLAALAWYGFRLWQLPQVARIRNVVAIGAVVYAAFQATALWQSSVLWGRPFELAMYWWETQPQSKRAHFEWADKLMQYGFPDNSVEVYEQAMARWPGDPALPISVMEIGCHYPETPLPPIERVRSALEQFDGHPYATINMVNRILHFAEEGRCQRYDLADLDQVMRWILATPQFSWHMQNLLLLRARISELGGDHDAAMQWLDQAIRIKPKMPILVQGVVWAAVAGRLDLAREYMHMVETHPNIREMDRWAYRETLTELWQLIEYYQDQAEAGGPT